MSARARAHTHTHNPPTHQCTVCVLFPSLFTLTTASVHTYTPPPSPTPPSLFALVSLPTPHLPPPFLPTPMAPYVTCATPNLYRQNYSVGIGTTKPSTASPASATSATTRRTQGGGIKPAVGRTGGGGGAHLTSSYGPNKSPSFLDKAPAGSGFAAARGTKASTWNGGGGGGGGGPGGLRRGMVVPRLGGTFPATKALASTLNHQHDKPHPPLTAAAAGAAVSPLSGPQQHAPPPSSGATRAYGLSSHELGAASHRGPGGFRSTVGRQLIGRQSDEHQGKYTIVFDLDETLVSNRMPGLRPALKRPFLDGLLKALRGKAELVLWTASIESVGRPVLRQIDPHGEYFDHAIFRNASWFHEKPNCPHTKDLRLLGRDFTKTLIVENNPFSVRLNKASAIMVPDFDRPNPTDSALRKVESFLSGMLSSGKPVPQFVSEHNGLHPVCAVKGWAGGRACV